MSKLPLVLSEARQFGRDVDNGKRRQAKVRVLESNAFFHATLNHDKCQFLSDPTKMTVCLTILTVLNNIRTSFYYK